MQFHAACAWTAGHRFGFSFSLVRGPFAHVDLRGADDLQAKPGKKEVVTVVDFKESQGVMHAGCWCKGHDMEGKTVYDMYELDPDQNEVSTGMARKRLVADEDLDGLANLCQLVQDVTAGQLVCPTAQSYEIGPSHGPCQSRARAGGQSVCGLWNRRISPLARRRLGRHGSRRSGRDVACQSESDLPSVLVQSRLEMHCAC